jgi:hypothetical protein
MVVSFGGINVTESTTFTKTESVLKQPGANVSVTKYFVGLSGLTNGLLIF